MLSYAAQSEARNASNCETQQSKVRKQRAAARQHVASSWPMVHQRVVKMSKNSAELPLECHPGLRLPELQTMRVVLALSLLSSAAAGVAQVDYFFGSK